MESEFLQGRGESEEIPKEALEVIWLRCGGDLSRTREGPQASVFHFHHL